ncbi:MAG TPA: acyl carrier protein [Bryobacteraceae bacterium]|jgi:acyl carrier protein|nr:acyl carrier protein [Bryobacteraceae bacterium]
MDEIRTRLIKCFETVFPDLPAEQIPNASQSSVANWDSIAAITLINVIEEEFQITMDLEMAGELDSFPKILEYLKTTAVNA